VLDQSRLSKTIVDQPICDLLWFDARQSSWIVQTAAPVCTVPFVFPVVRTTSAAHPFPSFVFLSQINAGRAQTRTAGQSAVCGKALEENWETYRTTKQLLEISPTSKLQVEEGAARPSESHPGLEKESIIQASLQTTITNIFDSANSTTTNKFGMLGSLFDSVCCFFLVMWYLSLLATSFGFCRILECWWENIETRGQQLVGFPRQDTRKTP